MTGTETGDADATGVLDGTDDASASRVTVDADPETFQALGNEVRLSVLRHLLAREQDGRPVVTFSALQAATGADTSAGFAYHLRQLTDQYVRNVERDRSDDGDEREGYVLTYAGRKIARAIAAGTYTESVDLDPIALDDPCPHCGDRGLLATCTDNVVGIACGACNRPVLSLPFPPQGHRDRPPSAVPRAFDRHHRHRLALLREGVCPECAGRVEAAVERPTIEAGDDSPPGTGERADPLPDGASTTADAERAPIPTDAETPDETPTATRSGPVGRLVATFECGVCGHATRTPVTLSLLYHPAVVAFYHDHGIDLRERPLWNVGAEWRETLLSTDPWAVAVSTELGDERLELFVDRRARVVEHRREPIDDG